MGVKIKVKLDGKDAKDMARDGKVSEAFHEVYANTPKSVVKTGKTGKAKAAMMTAIALSKARAAGAKVPGPEGANYISRNDLHLPEGVTPGRSNAGERVPYKKAASVPTAEPVPMPARDLNPVERERQKLNRVRDRRSNLGRGKPSIVETES